MSTKLLKQKHQETVFTVSQLAKALDIKPITIRSYIEEGKIKGEKVNGKWLVKADSLGEFYKQKLAKVEKEALVTILNDDCEPRIDSRILAELMGVKHKATIQLIRKHIEDLEDYGKVPFQMAPSESGQIETVAFLNEEQSRLHLMYSRNTAKTKLLKKKLNNAFTKYKKAYLRQARQAEYRAQLGWQQARAEGKLIRRTETDTIKKFVEYATAQGSKNAHMYYVNLTKMTNKALFFLEQACPKPNNLRNILSTLQLIHLSTADSLVVKALEEGMEKGMHYKEIYRLAKSKVEALALLIGKTLVLEAPKMALIN